MSNLFASSILLAWPLITMAIFQRLSVQKAAAVSIVAGYLLLPTPRVSVFDLPLVPPWDKELMIALPALIMAAIKSRPQPGQAATEDLGSAHVLTGWLPQSRLIRLCVLGIVLGPFFTAITNSDTLNVGGWVGRPLGIREAGSSIIAALISVVPFLLARKYFASSRDHVVLLGVFCMAGLAYSLPALYEIRMSPQLNNMVYGFFPHSWAQHIRGNGFRPLVFLEHGLRLAIFLAVACLSALSLMRSQTGIPRAKLVLAALWLLGTLILCKSLTGLLVAVVLGGLILGLGVRMQMLAAAAVAVMVLTYPIMRSAGLVPITPIVSTLSAVAAPERINSLEFRLRSEDRLVAHANQRPLFGWGRFGRNLVFNDEGKSTAIAEGSWIILFGQYGWIGYLSQFGLLTVPIVLLAIRRRHELTLATSTLSLVLVGNLFDLIPNSGLTAITWLMAGALAGRLELGRVMETSTIPTPGGASGKLPAPRYNRGLSAGGTPGPRSSVPSAQRWPGREDPNGPHSRARNPSPRHTRF